MSCLPATTGARLALAGLLLLGTRSAHAQTPRASRTPMPPAQRLSPERLQTISDSLPRGASRTAPLGKGVNYTFALTRRDSAGTLEVHDGWTDVFLVQSGRATLQSGGIAEGAKESSPGEWRGGTATGASTMALRPGDVVVIPAGTPHRMSPEAGRRVGYVAFKIAATPAASATTTP